MKSETVVGILRSRARNQSDTTAYTFLQNGLQETGSSTYGALDQKARAIAALLQRQMQPGERALLLYPQDLDYVAAFFGCLYAGVIAIPAYPPRPNQSLSRILSIAEDARPALALTTSDIKSKMEARHAQDSAYPNFPTLVTDTLNEANIAELAELWQDPGDSVSENSIAYLQYTSGSTSTPKGVMVTHGNLLANLLDMDLGWGHAPGSVLVTWLPFFHDMGLIYGVLEPLYKGFPCYFMPPLAFLQRPVRWLQAISHFRATHSVAPNFAYELCVQRIKPEEQALLDLSSWVVAVNGAEPVRKETLDRFAGSFSSCGFRYDTFCPGYGLAEATLKVTAVKKGAAPAFCTRTSRTFVGCGSSANGARVAIVHPERLALCGPDEEGEIWVSGASIAKGYWNRPDETDATFGARLATGEGPFLRTGDLGFIRDGELYIAGRLKDLIIIRGQNHHPNDIEKTSEQSHPGLKKPGCCAAFSVEISNAERLVVVQGVERLGTEEEFDEMAGSIRQAISEEHDLQAYKVVLVRSGDVLRTTSGKVQRQACRQAYLDGTLPVLYQ